MYRVMTVLDEKIEGFRKAPLFKYLRDPDIAPERKLIFAPTVAHFVMSFADLYQFILPEIPACDQYQALVNAHTREDANHWRWYLSDLQQMNHNLKMSYSEALHLVWSDATVQTRLLSYHMCRLGFKADSLRKLILVYCIEATGKVTLENVAAVGNAFVKGTDKKLKYFGGHHFDRESEHTIEQNHVQQMVKSIVLDDKKVVELSDLIVESFQYFTAFVDEILEIIQKERSYEKQTFYSSN